MALRAPSRSSGRFGPVIILVAVLGALGGWHLAGGPVSRTAEAAAPTAPATLLRPDENDRESAAFAICASGPRTNCVVDGDTIYYRGTKIRIADIDTPEISQPRCPQEAQLGAQATRRLQALVNNGPFSIEAADRDEDRFGRKLRILTRGGQSLGGVLVNEGLARWYQGGRRPWC